MKPKRFVPNKHDIFMSLATLYLGLVWLYIMSLEVQVPRKYRQRNKMQNFGGQLQYLTVIALSMTCISLIAKRMQKLFKFYMLTLVVETIVTAYYWTLYVASPSSLFPFGIQPLSLAIELSLHVMPIVLLWYDLIVNTPAQDVNKVEAARSIFIFASLYMAWMELCKSRNSFYPYPLVHNMKVLHKSVLVIVTVAFGVVIETVAMRITYLVKRLVKKSAFDSYTSGDHDNLIPYFLLEKIVIKHE